MIVLPPLSRFALRANHINRRAAAEREQDEPDPAPVLKFFNPLGGQTWLATELAENGDVLWGLADLGFGCPEIGPWSLVELSAIRLPFGIRIEIDTAFTSDVPLSVWATWSRRTGSILWAETLFRRSPPGAPPSDP
ncbi:DUF2958 domain-containing protein [Sphingomonas sp.]|uniref:DUF2958 domain-containing protein n=1 Tax=Sphingomonas sp. TaxID=28214 RepID=UPI0025D05A37|nr:DUF2958 domain-containing protein [Sphingomonas sp.]MBV9528625.1 DUF2958 domain-containing protein [Sphingomonas sp.]MBV9841713.1 DUF2958 domain-containing protein [Sphingomonadaceae bacterium]